MPYALCPIPYALCRIVPHLSEKGYIHFQLANREIFQDLDKFWRWFCPNVRLGLQLGNQIAEYGDELFGSQISCKMYFQQYLLLSTTKLLVLA
ncbi:MULTISPECIES: AAA-like domain-containing protein [unclassified Microcoleus]|uniref:AAA-like domain-containing protein n=1 Tax=unclassified Microcoleus TaxID=2642155 RepID=UPI002FD52872